MSEAHSDHGTVLPRDAAAIVWSPTDGFTFLMPEYPEEQDVPGPVIAMASLITKMFDEDFVQQLIQEFENQAKN